MKIGRQFVAGLAAMLVIVSGCSSSQINEAQRKEDQEYLRAINSTNPWVGEEFLKKYPNTPYVEHLREHIEQEKINEKIRAVERQKEDEEFEPYQKIDTIKSYKEFLSRYPNSRHRENALRKINDLTPHPNEIIVTTGNISTPYEPLGEITVDEIAMIWDHESAIRDGNDLLRSRARERYDYRAHAIINVHYRVGRNRFFASGLVVQFSPPD